MSQYYYESKSSKGVLAINKNVFMTVAENALKETVETTLKDKLSLKDGKKNAHLVVEVDEKKVNIKVEIFAIAKEKLDENFALLQTAIHDAIYDATEISAVKVNISLLGFTK